MTWEEEIVIKAQALMEELNEYRHIPETYCAQARGAIFPLDLDRLFFCLKSIGEWFEESEDLYSSSNDYKNLKIILSSIEKRKVELNKRERENIPLMQFWTAFTTWLDEEAKDPASLYSKKYQDGYSDWGCWFTVGQVDLDKLYNSIYGKPFIKISIENISFQIIKDFLEAYYKEVVEVTKGRLSMTIKVNELLNRFQLPYKLQKGKLTQSGYKTTFKIDKIENYEQFERKIEYATEMIMHGEFIDKHCALKYITDAFCYFLSLYKKDADKKLGELVTIDNNTRVYKLIKDEVSYIGKIINDDFDIRHNEQNSSIIDGQHRKRETLNDPIFVEYLYNRINSLLMLFRIKRNQRQKAEHHENILEEIDEGSDLPF